VGHYFGKKHNIKHHTWLCGQDAKADNRYVKYIKPSGGELIAMSDFLRREFAGNHRVTPVHTIPIGVNTVARDVDNGRDIDLLGVGSLIPLKQYDVFVEVVKELARTIPDIKAEVCGDGPEKAKLFGMILAGNLVENVVLIGEVPHRDVLQKMERAKIFVHTSCYEGFGTVCLEALHAGAHVVSFTKPMDRDIDHWHHVKDKEEMVHKIKELLMQAELNHDAVAPYTTAAIGAELLRLYS
jgi:glycosyltransferase involved in cell wall biosynthesis